MIIRFMFRSWLFISTRGPPRGVQRGGLHVLQAGGDALPAALPPGVGGRAGGQHRSDDPWEWPRRQRHRRLRSPPGELPRLLHGAPRLAGGLGQTPSLRGGRGRGARGQQEGEDGRTGGWVTRRSAAILTVLIRVYCVKFGDFIEGLGYLSESIIHTERYILK